MAGYLTGISPSLRELVTPTVDNFAAGAGFTAGSSTSVTLSSAPGDENRVIVTMDGVTQHHNTFTVSGTTLTFDTAIPSGVANIEARYAQENPNYTTVADNAISSAKIADGAVTSSKLASGATQNTSLARDNREAFLQIASLTGKDRLNMDDGSVDPYADGSDIGTATNASLKDGAYIGYSATTSASGEWTDSNSTATFTGDDITFALDDAIYMNDTFSGDFQLDYTFHTGTYFRFGFWLVSEQASFNANSSAFHAGSDVWHVDNYGSTGLVKYGSSTVKTHGNFTTGQAHRWTRTSGVFKLYLDGDVTTPAHTWTQTSTAAVRCGGGDTSTPRQEIRDISWVDYSGSPANMTLISNAFTADAAPGTGRIYIHVKENESITINTDITAEISRDGGSTWTSATLSLVQTLADGTKAYENPSVNISSQPSGTSMKYRLKSLNTKDVEFLGTVFQWGT